METIVERVMAGCKCSHADAEEYLQSEVDNLRDIRDHGGLRFDDFTTACSNLGLDQDCFEYFFGAVSC